jgi:hypothetical protein
MIDEDKAREDLTAARDTAFQNVQNGMFSQSYWTGYFHAATDALNALNAGAWNHE